MERLSKQREILNKAIDIGYHRPVQSILYEYPELAHHNLLKRAVMASNDAEMDRVVRVLIEAGVDPNLPWNWKNGTMTPLMYLCLSNFFSADEVIEELLRGGADVNLQDREGDTALMYLIDYSRGSKKFNQIFNMLIDAGADIDLENDKGQTVRSKLEN